jgi:ribosomal protein S4
MKRSKVGKKIKKALKEGLRWAKGEIELPTTVVEKIPISRLIHREGLESDVSECRRAVAQGAVKLNGTAIEEPEVCVRTGDVLEVGTKSVVLVIGEKLANIKGDFTGTKIGQEQE